MTDTPTNQVRASNWLEILECCGYEGREGSRFSLVAPRGPHNSHSGLRAMSWAPGYHTQQASYSLKEAHSDTTVGVFLV